MPIGTKQSIIDSLESDTDFDVIVVLVRRNASKKEIEKQKKKTIEAIHNRPEKESNYFTFSKPVFSNDKKYALLSYAKLGSGGQCIFKNNNGIWELVLENNWVA